MSDPTLFPFVAGVSSRIPVWMSRSVGFRFLCSMILLADVGVQVLLEALYARFPGLGTNTALPSIGYSRGMVRGMGDTDLSFGARLTQWLTRWQVAGSQLAIASAIQDYCAGNPKIVVVNRSGTMTTLAAGASSAPVFGSSWTVQYGVAWNWDGLSNPARAGYWSEEWIIVYTPPWPISGTIDTSNPTKFGLGLGTQSPRADVDAIKGLLDTWKSAHSYVRALIFSYDPTLFNPAVPASMPDGTWGYAGFMSGANLGLSSRGVKEQAGSVRVWEPSLAPTPDVYFGPV